MPFDETDEIHKKVLHIADMFAMYRAELARILHIRCEDITALEDGSLDLSSESETGQQAEYWVALFDCIYQQSGGDEVRMCHWLRATHSDLNMSPLLYMVDNDGLAALLTAVRQKKSLMRLDRLC
ncbi:MAG: hypothetical protein GXP22_00655 [Gammaproteobacteria bacterium]|nr:hypothetical protein [Gammaproteobacteria bacterium]